MIKNSIRFMENGVAVFREAAVGSYGPSQRVKKLIEELSETRSGASIDKQKLMNDRRAITRDVGIAFEKLK